MFKGKQTTYSIQIIGLVWKEEIEDNYLTGEEKDGRDDLKTATQYQTHSFSPVFWLAPTLATITFLWECDFFSGFTCKVQEHIPKTLFSALACYRTVTHR